MTGLFVGGGGRFYYITETNRNRKKETPKFTIKDGIIEAESISWRKNDINFGKVLLTEMQKNSKFVGQVNADTEEEDTFGNMANRTVKCAKWLLSQGVKSGDVIAICTPNHLDAAIPVVASLCIGAIFNPWWDLGLTRDITKHFMNLAKPKVVFASEEHVKIINDVATDIKMNFKIVTFGKSAGFVSFDDIARHDKTNVDNFQCTELKSVNEGAYIEYTSGSTGLAKGALHSHKSLFGNIASLCGLGDGNNIVLCYSSLCWITGVLCTLLCITRLQRRIIAKTFTPENLCQLVEKYKITWLLTGTSLANRLLKSGELSQYDVSSLKYVWVGGAPLKVDTQDALRAALPATNIIQLYGITEIGGVALHQTRRPKPNSVGTLARSFQMKVIDPENGRILGPNEKGEICFKSPFMMTGYYNNSTETKKAFKSDGWFHTGDLAYYDEDGAVYIIDRLKELIKWRGHHVPPSVVEQIIQTYPGVTEAAVVGVPDWEDDERPIAFITKSLTAKVSEDDIVKLVEKHLPEQMWLRAGVQIVDQLPHTASGKIGRTEIKKMATKLIRKS